MPAALRAPRLRRLILAYAINRAGTWFGVVALSLAVYDHTHKGLAVAALLIASQAVPAFVVPLVIARVEASKRRRELSFLYFFEAVVTAGLAVLLGHFALAGILVLVALDGTAALTASALLRTEAARLAREELPGSPDEAEQSANAALNVAFSATFVLGPAAAGIVVAAASASTALYIDVVSFAVCGVMLLDLHPHIEEVGEGGVAARLQAAWEHIRGVTALRDLLLAQAIGLVFFESAAPIEVAYVKRSLLAGDRGYGYLVTAWGVGVVIGSILFARLGQRRLGIMLTAGTLAIGAAYASFAAVSSLAAAAAAAVVGGVGNGIQFAPVISGVQRLTPGPLRARVMGAVEALGAICPAFGLILGGVLVTVGSPRTAFAIVGAGAALTAAAFARIRIDQVPAASELGEAQAQPLERDDLAAGV
ncbi:MAG: MFS transporter [Solirubrobacteraceae bacterium]